MFRFIFSILIILALSGCVPNAHNATSNATDCTAQTVALTSAMRARNAMLIASATVALDDCQSGGAQ